MSEAAVSGAPSEARHFRSMIGKSLLLAAGLIGAGLVLQEIPARPDATFVDRFITGHGLRGEFVFMLAGAAACAAGLPRQAVAFTGGYALGPWIGGVLALMAQRLGCLANFAWGPICRGRLGCPADAGPGRAARSSACRSPVHRDTDSAIAPDRQQYRPQSPCWSFDRSRPTLLAASLLGYLPQTMVFALLGAGVGLGESSRVAAGMGLFGCSVLLGLVLLPRERRHPSRGRAKESAAPETRPGFPRQAHL
jgi:hypothetical protein